MPSTDFYVTPHRAAERNSLEPATMANPNNETPTEDNKSKDTRMEDNDITVGTSTTKATKTDFIKQEMEEFVICFEIP
jgi:hypothetical protein